MPQRRFAQHSRPYVEFRRRLRQAREEAELSQEDVAKKLRRHQSWVSKNESGERRVDVVELAQLARLYGKPIEWFVA